MVCNYTQSFLHPEELADFFRKQFSFTMHAVIAHALGNFGQHSYYALYFLFIEESEEVKKNYHNASLP